MKNFKKILSNQSGISLIEITMAAAMSVIISLGVMKTNETGQKGMTKVATDLDLRMWQQQVLFPRLADSDNCLATFNPSGTGNPNSVDTSLTQLRTVSTVFATVNQSISTGGTDSWTLKSIRRAAFESDGSSGGNKGICKVTLTVERNNKKSFGPSTRDISFPLICVRAGGPPANQWSSCSTQGSGGDSLWTKHLDTEGNYIHSGGESVRVGLGNDAVDIAAPFEVRLANGFDFPAGTTGVQTSMLIPAANNALQLGANSAIYEDASGCTNIVNAASGDLNPGLRHCTSATANNINIGSEGGGVGVNNNHSMLLGSSDSVIKTNFSVILGGSNSLVEGINSFTRGAENKIKGSFVNAMGKELYVDGNYATALGSNSIVKGDSAVAIGNDTRGNGHYSVAIGQGAHATHNHSMVLGSGRVTEDSHTHQFVANFRNGYKFITTRGGNITNWPPATSGQRTQAATSGVFISPTGSVGIGYEVPSYKLHVNGTVAGTADFVNTSDRRFKKNFTPISEDEVSALEKILKVNGLYFEWRHDEFPGYKFNKGQDMGVIAQEVEKVFPEAVKRDSKGYRSVAYAKLVAPIIEAIKDLFGMVSENSEEIDTLNKKVDQLEQENREMKEALCEINPKASFCNQKK